MLEEGGYYAIKGFSYQYIVSLIEVFNSTNDNKQFSFENIQDFNDDDVIYQMKYKETQNFVNSKIKEPTIKIFEQFKIFKKNYILYTYFNDKENEELEFSSIDELDKILLNCKIDGNEYKFTPEEKKEFIKHFKVIFSKNYMDKVEELIEIVKKELDVSENVAEIYYYNLVTYVINLIVSNKPQDRKTTKKELVDYLKNISSMVFYDFYLKYNKKDKYLKHIAKEYFFEKNINDYNRIFIVNLSLTSVDDCYDCVCKIVKRYYVINKRGNMIKSHAPYIYFANIDNDLLIQLKNKMFDDIIFTDGYCYKNSNFNVDFITKKFKVTDNICCKLISNAEDFEKIINKLGVNGLKIYEFYNKENRTTYEIENIISIKVDNVLDICKILN